MGTKKTCGDVGEFELIHRIEQLLPPGNASVVLGVGDDAAAVHWNQENLLLSTVDAQVEGVHFEWHLTTPEKLGHKLAAINLSDLAAMGGTPRFALVNLAVPPDLLVKNVENFYSGLTRALTAFSVSIIGGNISAASRFSADLTLLGEVFPSHLKTRTGAQVGDLLCVTGTLGKGAAGLKIALQNKGIFQKEARLLAFWQTPRPQLKAGGILGTCEGVHALIDISDGLAGDLAHLAEASGVGAVVEESLLPVHPDVRNLAKRKGDSFLDWVLFGGEDYELLFTAAEENYPEIRKKLAPVAPPTVIGKITEPDGGVVLHQSNGKTIPIPPRGWDHFKKEKTKSRNFFKKP